MVRTLVALPEHGERPVHGGATVNPAPQACAFDGDDAPGAPRVWALDLGDAAPGILPEAARQRARDRVRAALRTVLADAWQLPAQAIVLDDQRGAPVRARLAEGTPPPPAWRTPGLSIGHEGPLALFALRRAGPVGVDLATLPAAWQADGDAALRPQAALYLGPAHAAARVGADAACFVLGWAELEARLKCLAQPLTEWSPALAARLAHCRTASVRLPPPIANRLPAPWAAVVAWADTAA